MNNLPSAAIDTKEPQSGCFATMCSEMASNSDVDTKSSTGTACRMVGPSLLSNSAYRIPSSCARAVIEFRSDGKGRRKHGTVLGKGGMKKEGNEG